MEDFMASQIEMLFMRLARLVDEGKYDEAIRVADELTRLSPDLPDTYIKRATSHFEIADSLQGDILQRELRKSHIESGVADLTKTIDLMENKYYSIRKQIADYDKNLAMFYSHRAKAKIDLAKLTHFQPTKEDIPDIMRDLKKAVEHDENNVMAYREMGKIYEDYLDDPKLAAEQFSESMRIKMHPLDYFHRAWCNYWAGNVNLLFITPKRNNYGKSSLMKSNKFTTFMLEEKWKLDL
jgi:tetratricopeptide (TPR) repeat protein